MGGYNGFNLTPFKGKIKYFKSVNPELDIIPVLDSQMRPCFYDRISKQFYYHTNSTGSTTPAYKRWNKFDVDYIESSGTQYIDTKYIPTNNSVYKFKAECTEDASGVRTVFGSRNVDDTASSVAYLYSTSSNARWATKVLKNSEATALEPHTCTLSKNGYEVDGITEQFAKQTFTGTSTNSVYLFALHLADGTASSISKIKCWNFIIEENGSVKRNYKPTVWHNGNTTAIACLYDEIYNKMYTNAGTGSFKAYIVPNKELFTQAGATKNKVLDANGVINDLDEFAVSDKIPVTPSSTVKLISGSYFASATATGGSNWRFSVYNSSNQQITQYVLRTNLNTTQPVEQTETLANNASYIRVSYRYTKTSDAPAGAILDTSTISIKDITTYEVGSNCLGTPDTVLGTSNCFDTGIYGNQDMQVKLITYLPTNTQVTGQLFGSYDGSEENSQNYTINSTHTSGTAAPIRFDGRTITNPIKKGSTKVSIVDNKLGIWVDNALHASWSPTPNDFTTTTTLLVMKCNNSSNVRQNGCCYLLIEENLVPILEYIPVRNATVTTSYGLYDRVNGTLNTGIGTITFNALS